MKTIKLILGLIILAVATAIILSKSGYGGFRLYVVESGSMTPKIGVGSVILVKKVSVYRKNDVVTFAQSGRKNVAVTHRIVGIETDSTGAVYTTKGDHNEDPDAEKVPQKDVIGKVILSLPLFGYFVGFSKTIHGFYLLVVVPACIIIFGELKTIAAEAGKLGRKGKYSGGWQRLKLACLLLVCFRLIVPGSISGSKSAISDRETAGVSLTAGIWPTVDLSYSSSEHKIKFTVFNTGGYVNLSYTLTYKTDGVSQGEVGNTATGGQDKITRETFTGTCSSGDCSNYTNIHDIELKITLTDGAGNTKDLNKTL